MERHHTYSTKSARSGHLAMAGEWLKSTHCYHLDDCSTATALELVQAIT
jgi:hypothetical protein